MIIESIKIRNFGPFAVPTLLKLEEDVTVLTGPNDTGKSYALRAIELVCTGEQASEEQINTDRIDEIEEDWTNDDRIDATVTFQVTDALKNAGMFANDNIREGDKVIARTTLNQAVNNFQIQNILRNSKKTSGINAGFQKKITAIKPSEDNGIRDIIDLNNMNESELCFLRLGFGPKFSMKQFDSFSYGARQKRISRAQSTLNAALKSFLPRTMPLTLHLCEVDEKGEHLSVFLSDQ